MSTPTHSNHHTTRLDLDYFAAPAHSASSATRWTLTADRDGWDAAGRAFVAQPPVAPDCARPPLESGRRY
jgi:hypothetical protein